MDELRPDGRQRRTVAGGPLDGKPFAVTGYEVWCAWQQVRDNKGAPGVDGQSIAAFEERLEDNLYKIWNRMSAGSYLPPPVKAVEIPKPGGGTRTLGVPTIADRVAQTVAANRIGTVTERFFHADSYGYRPGRGAHDALAVARRRCWNYDWVIEFDIRKFFDSVPHDLVVRAVEALRLPAWVLLYVKRWLAAPVIMPDGEARPRDRGTPQGSAVTPPTQWITSASMSRWATGGWRSPGVSRPDSDISGSTLMTCLFMAVLAAGSMLSGSTRRRSWPRGACRRPRRRGCWRAGSAARCGRPAGMWTRRRRRAGCRSLRPPWCSRSRCRPGWRPRSGSTLASRGGRSPPWPRRRWRNFSPGAAETILAGERPAGRGGVRLRPPRGRCFVGGLRHIGAAAAGPHRAGRPGRTAAA